MNRRWGIVSIGLLSFPLAFLAPAQSPPEGFKSFESKAKGIFFHLPVRFEELPVQPGEDIIQLRFTEKETARNEHDFRPEIWIFQIEKKAVTTGSDSKEPKNPPEDDDEEEEEKEEKLKPGERPKIYSIEDFFAKRVKDWDLKPNGSIEREKEKPISRYLAISKKDDFRGIALVHDLGNQSLCLVGFALSNQMADYQKMFERSAKSLKLKDSGDAFENSIAAYYKNRPFRNVEYRIKVRTNLPKGWKADDTENFILIYSTKDEYLLAKVKNDLEAIRTKYLEIFPPKAPIEAVSTVRICKDHDEFVKFSGIPNANGYWNYGTEELVLFDRDGFNNKGSMGTMYHEAFHQYIHYACGQIAPHYWFNEGFGDYFGGAKIGRGGKKVDGLEPRDIRLPAAKYLVEKHHWTPLKEFVEFEREQYYDPKKVGLNYAQGWSLVYFLNTSKVVKKHPIWSGILDRYFKTLQETYQEKLSKLGEKPTEEQTAEAQLKARKAANRAAFKDVDFDQLEKEWEMFVLKLKDP